MQKANKNIKVVHISFAFYPYMNLGGVPRAVFDIVRAQSDRYKITVITNRIENTAFERINNCEVIYLKNISRGLIYNYQFYTPIFSPKLLSIIKKADILHFHGLRNLLNEIVSAINVFFKRPSLITTHGTMMNYESKMWIKRVYDRSIGSYLVDSSRYIVAHSEIERYKLIEMGVNLSKTAVIQNGIYFEDLNIPFSKERFCNKYGIDNKKRIILFIGKITKRKGLNVSIEAIKRLKNRDLQMVVAGEPLGIKIVDLISHQDIKYIGHLNTEEKIDAIGAADILLYPSIYEAFGYVPFEALYLNRPCIIGDDFGSAEHLSPVVPELIVSYGDAIELSGVILKFLENKKYAEAVVKKGREYILQKYSMNKVVEEYDKVYRKIVYEN